MPFWGYILIGLGALLFIFLIIFVLLKKKKPKLKIDNEFINELILNYGGIENITSTQVDNGRLKITVSDLNKVDLNRVKALSNGGVFVTGNIIKTLYRLDSIIIKNAIDNMR